MKKLPLLTLGDLEIAAMECIWRLGEGDVKRVHAKIGTPRGLASNTVQSTLDRLYKKGLLRREKVAHAFVYSAAIDRGGLAAQAIDSALSRLSTGETGFVLAALVDFAARTDPKTLSELERLVAERLHPKKAE